MMVSTMNVLERMISIFAPHNCLVCSTEGHLLCSDCAWALGDILPGRCYRCNKISPLSKTCCSCRKVSVLNHVWIRAEYKNTAKELVYCLKFGRLIAAADSIATAMYTTLPHLENTIIVPVPTATSRMRQRGYDQSVVIARKIARLCGLPMQQYVVRLGQTRQVGSKKVDRISQLNNAYEVKVRNSVRGKYILLVDDVMTTGSTLESAARVLRKAGAKQVDAAVFARVYK